MSEEKLIDMGAIQNCQNLEESYGEICVKCNKCGRFNAKKWTEGEELFSILSDTINGANFDDLNDACYRILDKANYHKQEWISVDERLPEQSGEYLTYHKGVFSTLEYSKRHKLFNAADDLPEAFSKKHSITVSHWTPLPEPPKMKGGTE